jgi:hypothetical protein
MDQPGIPVKREDHRLVAGEQGIEVVVAQAVRVLAGRLQLHQVDHVDHADLELGKVRAQNGHRGQGLEGRHVARAGHDQVGLALPVVARPLPHANAFAAVLDRVVHSQPLRRGMLAGDHHVDVVPAPQAMIHDGQQAIRVGRQVHADDFGLLVDHVVDESRVLMRESIVVLAPDVGAQQVVERCDLGAPRQARGHLEPLGVLVEHRVDDVDECLVAVEQAVPPGEQVPFEPALALMLAQHLHHLALGRQVLVARLHFRFPLPARDLKHRFEPVGHRFIRAEDAKVPRL